MYEALWPVWVEEFSEADERVLISAHDTVNASVSSVMASGSAEQLQVEATYSLRVSRQRNHQAWFSSRTKSAYGYRCALSGLPLRNLLVGAHILPDAQGGPASVTNGICMSTLHHTAFDTNLIGIDPDFRVHVASPDIASRAAMIAQDFARVSLLGAFSRGARGGTPRKKTAARGDPPRKKRDGSIAAPYGVATMCAHAGKRPARARPAQFAPERISEKSY